MSALSIQRIATHTKVSHWLNYEDYMPMAIIVISIGIVRKSPLFWIMLPLAYTILAGKLSASLMSPMERKPLARKALLLVGCIGVIAPVIAHLPTQASAPSATKGHL